MTNTMSVKYTMLVRGKLNAQADEAWCVVHDEAPIDIAEGNDVDTPMAFTFRREPERGPSRYRLDRASGRIFERIGKAANILESENYDVDHKYPTYRLEREVSDRARLLAQDGQEVVGTEFRRYIRLGDLSHFRSADVEEGKRELARHMAGWLTMGGYFWAAIAEPVFHVYRTNDGWKTALEPYVPNTQGQGRPGHDRRHFHFGLGEYEELLTFKDHLSRVTARPSTADEFVAFGEFEPSIIGARIDLTQALEDIMVRFSKACDPKFNQVRKPLDFVHMPMPLLDLFHSSRKLAQEASDGWSDDLAGRIVSHLEDVAEFVTANPKCRELFAKLSENALHIDRWHSRPISLVAAFEKAPAP